jgi:hypothetical protein
MELLIGIMILFGGVGYVANKDAESRNATIVGKEIRFIQETKETTYKAEVLGGWRKVQ